MEYAFILFIIMSIGYTLYWIYGKIFGRRKPVEKHQPHINPYIYYHSLKIRDDQDYEEYLRFCAKAGEAPMDKQGFEAARKADREIRKLIR